MKILLATDGSADAGAALALLTTLPLRSVDEITVIAVIPPMPVLGAELQPPARADPPSLSDAANLIVNAAALQLEDAGARATTIVRRGHPAEEIITVAEELDVDLIALGAKGVGRVRRFLLGSVAHRVARHASCSVLATREPGRLLTLLVAVDGSTSADEGITALLDLPLPDHLQARVVEVVASDGPALATAGEHCRAAVARLNAAGIDATYTVLTANEVAGIITAAREDAADLIVVGAGQRTVGGEPILGSTAFGVLSEAPCSVLIGRSRPGDASVMWEPSEA